MNIVVVAPRLPFPLDKGDRLTVYHLLKYFSERHRVTLISFLEPEQDPAWVDKVAPFCERVELVPLRKPRAYFNCVKGLLGRKPLQLHYYADPDMRKTVDHVVREMKPDLLYAHLIRMGQYTEPYRALPRVTAFNVSMTLNYRRLAEHASRILGKAFYSVEYRKLRSFEGQFARAFDRILLISKYDLAAMECNTPLDNVFFNPHGVDYEYFSPDASVQKMPNTLVFTGNMSYPPNVDAALYLCQEILPLVRDQVPSAQVSIVGTDPTPDVKDLARDPLIEVTGRVPDLRAYMNRAEIAVAPMRIGAGLQNKVLEGMSMGLPMVITSVANEGIQAIGGENVVIADSARDFADQIVSLLNNPERRMRLGPTARDFIVRNWSWEKHFGDLEHMFVRLVNDKAQSSVAGIPSLESVGAGQV
jgi:sugar transferase (PEP-CTERM/EpsH1 system associated)